MAIMWGRGDVMEQKGSHEKHGFQLTFFKLPRNEVDLK